MGFVQSPDVDAAVRTGGGAAPTAEALPGLSIYLSEGTDEGAFVYASRPSTALGRTICRSLQVLLQ